MFNPAHSMIWSVRYSKKKSTRKKRHHRNRAEVRALTPLGPASQNQPKPSKTIENRPETITNDLKQSENYQKQLKTIKKRLKTIKNN